MRSPPAACADVLGRYRGFLFSAAVGVVCGYYAARKAAQRGRFRCRDRQLVAKRQIAFLDLSGALAEPRFYFDTDHLNRAGVTALFERHLKSDLDVGDRT